MALEPLSPRNEQAIKEACTNILYEINNPDSKGGVSRTYIEGEANDIIKACKLPAKAEMPCTSVKQYTGLVCDLPKGHDKGPKPTPHQGGPNKDTW